MTPEPDRPGRLRRPVRRGRTAGVLSASLLAAALLAGCGRHEFADRTAQVDLDGRVTTFDLDDCGLDGSTVYVVGQSSGGGVLQAVLGVAADESTGVPRSSGLTFGVEGQPWAAFGAESWTRRGESGPAPGTITSARLRGSRIQLAGEVVAVDDEDHPTTPARRVPFSLDARCDR